MYSVAPVCLGGLLLISAQDRSPSAAPPSFTRDVAPVLGRSCLSCHGQTQQMSLLDLSTRAAALKGGQKNGPAIVPGDSSKSPLYRRVTGQDQPAMPLGAKLSDAEIRDHQGLDRLRRDLGRLGGARCSGARAFRDERRREEVYRPGPLLVGFPRAGPSSAPPVTDARWNVNPIDAFLKQALDAKGLEVAPPADRRTLIRRAYLDMIGLLPSPDEVEAFINDPAPDAWEKRRGSSACLTTLWRALGPALAGRGTLCRQLGPHPRRRQSQCVEVSRLCDPRV